MDVWPIVQQAKASVRKRAPRQNSSINLPEDVCREQPNLFQPLVVPTLSVFRSLLDNLEVGVAHANVSGVLLYANPRFAEILGRPVTRIIGASLKRFVIVDGWDSLDNALKQAQTDVVEGTMSIVGGASVPDRAIKVSFAPILAGDRWTIEIVATEVTDLVSTTKALQKSEASLQSLSARLLQIQDEERRRLARDLHDTTGQELSLVIMTLEHVAKDLAVSSVGDREKTVLECVQRLRKAESDVRTLSYVLHPPLLDEMGLGSALGWYLDGYQKRTGIKVVRDIPARVPRFSLEKETALFRVIQECLTNVYRHSGSASVSVRLHVGPQRIQATVQDHGKGFASKDLAERPKPGVGLQSMKGRLELVGGSFEIASDKHGTRVVVNVPLGSDELVMNQEDDRDAAADRQTPEHTRRRILIADDHQVARRGIRILLEGQPDLEICGEACDGVDAVERAKELKPDLVILDLSMPKMGGLAAANQIRQAGLPTKILIYTSHSYSQLEKTARAAGCDGYVVKSDASQDLVAATRTVLSNGRFYTGQAAAAQSA